MSLARLERMLSERDDVLTGVRALFLAQDDADRDHLAGALTDEQVLALDPPEFVVDGWVPRGFYTVLYGEPGVKKTFVLLDMAKAIRRGTAWQDHAVQRGAVLFYQGEGLEQLTPRIAAWDAHQASANEPDAPGVYFDRNVDLTRPEGVAAVVRTVRRFQRENDCTVVAVVFDPLVEFMTGEENGEGMDLATRGLRAVARYLNVAVIVGHHTNASGERERGAAHLRMRSGAHIRAEALWGEQTGLVQQKQKNAEKLALVLNTVAVGDSLVLERSAGMTAVQYAAHKTAEENGEKAEGKIKRSERASAAKRQQAANLLIQYIGEHPGLSQTKVIGGCTGRNIGKPILESVLAELCEGGGPVVRESTGDATNSPIKYRLRE